MGPNVPILIISCDKYSDLWKPFFTIFWNRWPDCPYPIYLGSNHKTYDDLRVKPILIGHDISWASGVRCMLEQLGSSHVILLLEDFFIECRVDTAAISRLVSIAINRGLGSLRFAPLPPPTPVPSYPIAEFPDLGVVTQGTPYRVSTQAAVWRTETLCSLLIPGFTAWDFEHIGTQMSETLPDQFWGPYRPYLIYEHGVEKGKWKPQGLVICRGAGVEVDLKSRPALTEDELNEHYASEMSENHWSYVKARAIESFLNGERWKGFRDAMRYLRLQPLSMQLWIIVICGLLGPKLLVHLRRNHLRWRILKYRLQYLGTTLQGKKAI